MSSPTGNAVAASCSTDPPLREQLGLVELEHTRATIASSSRSSRSSRWSRRPILLRVAGPGRVRPRAARARFTDNERMTSLILPADEVEPVARVLVGAIAADDGPSDEQLAVLRALLVHL